MKLYRNTLIFLSISLIIIGCNSNSGPKQEYQATFESLEKADPVPEWFKDAKFGIYFHWGVYTVPAYANEWYPRTMYIKGSPENLHHIKTYGDPSEWPYENFIKGAEDKNGNHVRFAPKLKSEGGQFDPDEWAQLFHDAGAKFAGPVAEHHDGFSLWDSEVNPWNSADMGPELDLVRLFTDAIRERDMKVFLSLHHAFQITGYYYAVPPSDDPELQMLYGQLDSAGNEALWLSKHKEIIDNYQPDILYQDFNLHLISRPVLLEFLSHYYNRANEWNKEVVATFKDGLNEKCAVLDYERGGPPDITENYWLTDDAISSSSWCYTEGIGYYSKEQILHAFIDRISKNGNMILNISPRADGSIPQEQKDVLLAMGSWLGKYGEAIYATRAWEKYGEGPTQMGAAHGIMGAPIRGTSKDIRYTRSKDNKTLYAIMLGWDDTEKEITLESLSADRIDLRNLRSVELINGEAGNYLSLEFKVQDNGLAIVLPQLSFKELAYVLKLNFKGEMLPYSQYAELNTNPHYHIIPTDHIGEFVVGSDLKLSRNRKDASCQWKLEKTGKGVYVIRNRADDQQVLTAADKGKDLLLTDFTGDARQFWKIDDVHNESFRITNKAYPKSIVSLSASPAEGQSTSLITEEKATISAWRLKEVCELEQKPFKNHIIPGTIEVEDYDLGCPDDAYYDKEPDNSGRAYRPNEEVDIEECSEGGYNLGWTNAGEWLAYTVNIEKTATYRVTFHVASNFDNAKIHLECNGKNITSSIAIPNTSGFQSWEELTSEVRLEEGQHILKLVIDGNFVNLDKMVFEAVK